MENHETVLVFRFEGDEMQCTACPHCPEVPRPSIRRVKHPTFGDRYAVTTHGRLWSFERKIWLESGGQHSYARVRLSVKGDQPQRVVHQLVADAFPELIPEWDGKPIDWKLWEIDHADKIKKHNCVANLRVVPRGSQVKLGYKKGERKSKLRDYANQIRFFRAEGWPVKKIAGHFGVTPKAIYDLLSGKTHSDV
jgi:hypothetical protein